MIARHIAVAAALAAAWLGAFETARAQTYPPPPPPGYAPPPPGYYGPPPPPPSPVRSGFVIGFSLGGGSMTCDGCDEDLSGVALDIHLGFMLTPTLALLFDGSGIAHAEESSTLIHVVDTIALQAWLTPRFWLKGGLGLGQISEQTDYGARYESDPGPGILLAAGYEVMQSNNFALDLQGRIAAATYETDFGEELTLTNVSLHVGVNWY